MEGRERTRLVTPAWQLSEVITKGNLYTRHVLGSCKMKWMPTPLGTCQGIAWGKRGTGHRYEYMSAARYGTLLYTLDQVRTTTCSRTYHITGGKGSLLIYIRMNIRYDQTSLSGVCGKQSLSGLGPDSDHVMEQSLLHTMFKLPGCWRLGVKKR